MKRTQHERIARFLIAHRDGLTAVDCVRAPTFDGGPPIMRPASRIAQVREILDARGYDLVTGGKRDKCVVYRAARRQPAASPPAAESQALFVPAPPAPCSAIEGWER